MIKELRIFFFYLHFRQVVTTAEGQSLAKEYSIHFFETSAKQDTNVEAAFLTIATDVKNRMMVDGAGAAPTGGHKIVAGTQPEAKGGCC
jgi:Ras-related protein Rab-8A